MIVERDVNGRRAVADVREGDGATLVLVHGAGRDHGAWSRVLDALAGRRAAALSLPGRSGTAGPPLATVNEMAEWAMAFVRALEIERAVVCGHSLGGAVALEIGLLASVAARAARDAKSPSSGTEIAGLALVASGARLRVHPAILEAADRAAANDATARLPKLVYPPGTTPEVVAFEESIAARVSAATTARDWHAANGFDRLSDLGGLALPVIAIAGSHDPLTPPKYAEFVAAHAPRARAAIVEGAGHFLPTERPYEVASLIAEVA